MFNIITCCLLGCLLLLRSTDHCVIFALNMSVKILTRLKNLKKIHLNVFLSTMCEPGKETKWKGVQLKNEKRGDYFLYFPQA